MAAVLEFVVVYDDDDKFAVTSMLAVVLVAEVVIAQPQADSLIVFTVVFTVVFPVVFAVVFAVVFTVVFAVVFAMVLETKIVVALEIAGNGNGSSIRRRNSRGDGEETSQSGGNFSVMHDERRFKQTSCNARKKVWIKP